MYYKMTISFFLLLFCCVTFLQAEKSAIHFSKEDTISILEQSSVYITSENKSLEQIMQKNLFLPYPNTYINQGIQRRHIWIHFTLHNETYRKIERVLVLSSPLLEEIILYDSETFKPIMKTGMKYAKNCHETIAYTLSITLLPNEYKSYAIEIYSLYTPVNFSITLEKKSTFLQKQKQILAIDLILTGMIFALMLYAFLLSVYIKDKSYFFYGIYLMALLYQQTTYLGLTQIYFPYAFILFDMKIVITKITLLIITSALFAINFLETQKVPKIHTIYWLVISLSILELLFLNPTQKYSLLIVIFTGSFFVTFNIVAGILIYRNGHKQARLFIVGFGIVFFSYILIILDALGITSLMGYFQNALIICTVLEALILSFAFANRYVLLQKKKQVTDQHLLEALRNRESRIKQEVLIKTKELKTALNTQELLIREIHHRVKNNLQIILSMIRLQNDEIEDPLFTSKLKDLENRINTIAKTYQMLLISENLEEIEMQAYIESLLSDISETYQEEYYHIEIETDIHATMPLKASIYIGLIINELVINAYKYAFEDHKGYIIVKLHQNKNEYTLTIEDNGKGYHLKETNDTLGLKLIYTLVHGQLGGNIKVFHTNHTKYIIRFKL